MAIKAWGFEGSGTTPPEPQKPFGGKAWAIPGKIEMENFDVKGVGRGSDIESYEDNDAENHGDSDYRKDDAPSVDLYKKSNNRVVVGYIQKGEWLEYTVNVAKSGDYTMFAAVASDGGSSFKLSMDGKDITEDVKVPAAKKAEGEEQNFDDYNKVQTNVKLEAGEHILRFTATADWFDIDYINFVSGSGADDDQPLPGDSTVVPGDTTAPADTSLAIAGSLHLDMGTATMYDVFGLNGQKLASFRANSFAEARDMWKSSSKGAQGVSLIRNRSNGVIKKIH